MSCESCHFLRGKSRPEPQMSFYYDQVRVKHLSSRFFAVIHMMLSSPTSDENLVINQCVRWSEHSQHRIPNVHQPTGILDNLPATCSPCSPTSSPIHSFIYLSIYLLIHPLIYFFPYFFNAFGDQLKKEKVSHRAWWCKIRTLTVNAHCADSVQLKGSI